MKKTMKAMSILLIVALFTIILTTNVMATSTPSTIVDSMKPSYTDQGGLSNVGQQIISIISTVGVVIAVIVLLIIGIKYMMGSASEKAEYKKTMIPYLIGAVLVFGASAIAKVVIAMSQTITGAVS